MKPAQAEALSEALCAQLSAALAVEADRIYIEFTDATGPLWGGTVARSVERESPFWVHE